MKKTFWTGLSAALASIFLGFSPPSISAATTPVTYTSYSVQILPETVEDDFGVEWTLSLSSVGNHRAVNSELMPSSSGFTHETYFVLDNLFLVQPMVFEVLLDI